MKRIPLIVLQLILVIAAGELLSGSISEPEAIQPTPVTTTQPGVLLGTQTPEVSATHLPAIIDRLQDQATIVILGVLAGSFL